MNDPGISIITTSDIAYDKLLGPLPVVTNIMDTMVLLGLRCQEVRQTTQQIKVDPKDCDALASSNRYFHWLFYVQSARDDAEQNLELITKHGQLYYQAIRSIKAGEELLVWFNKELAEVFQVPDLGEFLAKDEGKRRCPYCNDVFSYPNPLKSHLMYRCDKRLAEVHGINSVNRLQLESINRLQLDWYSAAMIPIKPSSLKGFAAVSTLTSDFLDMYRRVAPSITMLNGEKENARHHHHHHQLMSNSDHADAPPPPPPPPPPMSNDYNGTTTPPNGGNVNAPGERIVANQKRKVFDVTHHANDTTSNKRGRHESPPSKRLSSTSSVEEDDTSSNMRATLGKMLVSGIIKVDSTRSGSSSTLCATATETTQVELVQHHPPARKQLTVAPTGAAADISGDTGGSAFKKVSKLSRPSMADRITSVTSSAMHSFGNPSVGGGPFAAMSSKPVYPIGYALPITNSVVGAAPPTGSAVSISAGSWSVPTLSPGSLANFSANESSLQSHPSSLQSQSTHLSTAVSFSGAAVPSSFMGAKMATESAHYSSIKFLEDIRPQPSSMALSSRTSTNNMSGGSGHLQDGGEASTVTVSYRNTLYPDSMYRLSVGLPYAATKQFGTSINNFVVRSPALPAITAAILPPSLTPLAFPAQNWCAKCNATFRMTSDLVYHMRSHHKRDVDPLKKKREEKLKCNICNESFRERHHLTRHMTSHQ